MTPVLASGPPSSLREDQVAARADDVAQHADDVDLELVEPIALEHGAADADHPGRSSSTGKVRIWAGSPAATASRKATTTAPRRIFMRGLKLDDTGKHLKLQGSWPLPSLTAPQPLKYCLTSEFGRRCCIRLAPSCARLPPAIGGGTGLQLKGRLPASDTRTSNSARPNASSASG